MIKTNELFNEVESLFLDVINGIKPKDNEFNFIGSRGSSKTHVVMDCIIGILLLGQNNVIYIFREKHGDLEDFKAELFPKIEAQGIKISSGQGGNFSNKHNTLTYGTNKIVFKALNGERMNIKKGQGAGLTVWPKASNIISFFEECTQIQEELVNVAIQGVRGNKNTNKISLFCANPWSPLNWYVKKCERILPQNLAEIDKNGYQKRVYYDEERKKNVVFIRNCILTNPYLDDDTRNEIESLKNLNYEFWKITARGISGTLGDTIYSNSLMSMKEYSEETFYDKHSYFQGGLDWGDGSSQGASPTAMGFLNINLISGVNAITEKTIWNNRQTMGENGTGDVSRYTTDQQIDKTIEFFKEQYIKYQRPFKVFVDNAALSDFYNHFNNRLALHGLTTMHIEFRPATKIYNIETVRVPIVNLLLSSGLLKINRENCKDLITALNNATWKENKNPKEGQKRDREHSTTHWINWLEYGLDHALKEYQTKWALLFK